jgi:hypothetical protein
VGRATTHERTTATAAATVVTAARTSAFAQSAGSRFGTAVSVERIIPVEYSPVMMSTPRTATTSFARSAPTSTTAGSCSSATSSPASSGLVAGSNASRAVKKTAR